MFGAPLRAPGTAPKEEEGGPFGFLGEAKMPVLSGVVMLVVIVTAWFTGAVDIPLPGFLVRAAHASLPWPRPARPRRFEPRELNLRL